MPHLSTHFLTKALLTGMHLTMLSQRLQDGHMRDIPALFEQVYFSGISVEIPPEKKSRFFVMQPEMEQALLDTLARLKHVDPMLALVTVMNVKERLATYIDPEQGRADPELLFSPLLEGMAELSSCEDLPPPLRMRAFILLLKDGYFDERFEGHLSALRSALRLLACPSSPEIGLPAQADLAACCINSARKYNIAKYEPEITQGLAKIYEPIALEATEYWKSVVRSLPIETALSHLCQVEFISLTDDLDRLAAEVTSHHYTQGHTHTTAESFRNSLTRLAPQLKIF